MTLRSSPHYPVVNVRYVHPVPEYSPQLDIILPAGDDPEFLLCCLLSENLPQFEFKEFP
jgi:hypothetical protein